MGRTQCLGTTLRVFEGQEGYLIPQDNYFAELIAVLVYFNFLPESPDNAPLPETRFCSRFVSKFVITSFSLL